VNESPKADCAAACAEDDLFALCGRAEPSNHSKNPLAGFSLLEVMIAMAVFFIVVFAILGVVVQSLGAARALQQQHADCGMVAQMWWMSNTVEPGYYSGDFEGLVPGYTWEADIPADLPMHSNGLYLINIRVTKSDAKRGQIGETAQMLKYTGQRPKKQ
jgi:hypothetical protein